MGATEHANQLRIGVLLTSETQMLDLAGIDLFGMASKEYLLATLPKPIVSLGLEMKVRRSEMAHIGVIATNDNASLKLG